MKRLAFVTLMLWGSAALAEAKATEADKPTDVCNRTARGWSDMRDLLAEIADYRDIMMEGAVIARKTLAKEKGYYIGEFTIHYARGKSSSIPNQDVCYPAKIVFEAGTSGGGEAGEDDSLYRCVAKRTVAGKIKSLKCELIAG